MKRFVFVLATALVLLSNHAFALGKLDYTNPESGQTVAVERVEKISGENQGIYIYDSVTYAFYQHSTSTVMEVESVVEGLDLGTIVIHSSWLPVEAGGYEGRVYINGVEAQSFQRLDRPDETWSYKSSGIYNSTGTSASMSFDEINSLQSQIHNVVAYNLRTFAESVTYETRVADYHLSHPAIWCVKCNVEKFYTLPRFLRIEVEIAEDSPNGLPATSPNLFLIRKSIKSGTQQYSWKHTSAPFTCPSEENLVAFINSNVLARNGNQHFFPFYDADQPHVDARNLTPAIMGYRANPQNGSVSFEVRADRMTGGEYNLEVVVSQTSHVNHRSIEFRDIATGNVVYIQAPDFEAAFESVVRAQLGIRNIRIEDYDDIDGDVTVAPGHAFRVLKNARDGYFNN